MMPHKGGEFQPAIWVCIWRGGNMPDFNQASQTNGKIPARGREGKCRDLRSKSKMIYWNSSRDVGQDGLAIFVDREKKIAARSQANPGDIFAMGEWKCLRLVSGHDLAD